MYQSATQEVSVTDGETSAVTLAMTPDFAEPVITCSDPNAEIWVNGEKKGVGSWNGRLAAGVYKIKASRKSHIDTEKAFTLNAGDNTQIDLDPPTPIYGFLQVASTPFAADIYLDGQKVGTTPKLLNNILIGDHELRIEKNDYATEVRNIKVEENKTTDISVELKNRETIKRTESVRTEENVYTDLASTETGNKAKRHHSAWITFVTLNGSYSPLPQFTYGITVGQMRFCGWYVSLMSNFNFRGAFKNFKVGETYSLTGSSKTTRLSVIGGFVLHPSNILALSIGADIIHTPFTPRLFLHKRSGV